MTYTTNNPPDIIKQKSKAAIELGVAAANIALSKGQSNEEAVLSAVLAVKQHEKKTQANRSVIQPKVVPLHVQALIKAKAANDFIVETKRLEQQQKQAADLEQWNNLVAAVDVDDQGRVVTTYNSGKKKYSKPLVNETVINRTIVVQQQTTTSTAEEDMYAKRVDFINDNLFYKAEAAPGSSESAGVWRISLVSLGADGDVTETWASGNANFTKSWTDRLLYTYS